MIVSLLLHPHAARGLLIECGAGHVFCFSCDSQPGHPPCTCTQWQEWNRMVGEQRAGAGDSDEELSRLWQAQNTKACPGCAARINKDQGERSDMECRPALGARVITTCALAAGCMHMTCTKCRHEFCWLCRGPWSAHGTGTGGFFDCNRSEHIQRDEVSRMSANATSCGCSAAQPSLHSP